MVKPREWPILRADATVSDGIKILRIFTEESKLEHGYSTPLVLDENSDLLGFVRLVDVLRSVRHVWSGAAGQRVPEKAPVLIRDLVIKFAGSVTPEDSILKALDIMVDNSVSLVPVMTDHKLLGIVKLSDAFDTVAALLFDEQDPEERSRLMSRIHF